MDATAETMICRSCLGDVWLADGRWWHAHGRTPPDYEPHPPIVVRRSIPISERPRTVVW